MDVVVVVDEKYMDVVWNLGFCLFVMFCVVMVFGYW